MVLGRFDADIHREGTTMKIGLTHSAIPRIRTLQIALILLLPGCGSDPVKPDDQPVPREIGRLRYLAALPGDPKTAGYKPR